MKNFFKRYGWLLIPFFITAGILLTIYALSECYPFGHRSPTTWDGFNQCYPFLKYLKRALLTGESLKYSFLSAMGMDNIALFSYYISSPVNLIVLFFPEKYILDSYMWIIVLKVSLSALSFALFAHYFLKVKKTTAVIFSLAYAFQMWFTVYSYFIMWLDGLIWLPLICVGVHKLVEEGKGKTLIAALTIAIFSNYYTGYMAGLFSALYFIYLMLIRKKVLPFKEWFRKGIHYITCGVLSGGLVSCILIPTYIFLGQYMDKLNQTLPKFKIEFDLKQIFFNYLLTDKISSITGIKIYIGLFSLILMLFFFFNTSFSWRKRIVSLCFYVFLMASLRSITWNLIWHMGAGPSGFPSRHSFVIGFFSILLAAQMFDSLKEKKKFPLIASLVIFLPVLAMICLNDSYINIDEKMNLKSKFLIINMSAVAVWAFAAFFVYKFKKGLSSRIITAAVLVCMCAELGYCGFLNIKGVGVDRNGVLKDEENTYDILALIKKKDDGLYRIGDMYGNSVNNGLKYNYYSISHHSSTENYPLFKFMFSLGYPEGGRSYQLTNARNIVNDTLFGIKYIFPADKAYESYPVFAANQDLNSQQNPFALPLIFAAPGGLNDYESGINTLKNQKLFTEAVSGEASMIDVEEYTQDAVEKSFEHICTKKGPLYFTFKSGEHNGTVTYNINNSGQKQMKVRSEIAFFLTNANPGDIVSVKTVTDNKKPVEFVTFSQIDIEKLSEFSKNTNIKTKQASVAADGLLEAVVDISAGDRLFISIPYSRGWKLFVDGKQAEIKKAFGHFMKADISTGEHKIKLSYSTPGGALGICVTIISLLAFVLWWKYFDCRFERKKTII